MTMPSTGKGVPVLYRHIYDIIATTHVRTLSIPHSILSNSLLVYYRQHSVQHVKTLTP